MFFSSSVRERGGGCVVVVVCVKSHVFLFYCSIFFGSCLGAPNIQFFDKYKDLQGKDPARMDSNESCTEGYLNGSRLCGGCDFGYTHASMSSKCDLCVDESTSTFIAVFGVLLGLIALVVFIRLTLNDEGNIKLTDGVTSIALSYIQLTTLLSTFPIAWPEIFLTFFRVGGAVTVIGQAFVNIKCMYPEMHLTDGDVFYSLRLAWSIFPLVLVGGNAVTWLLLSTCRKITRLKTKIKTSTVALFYLLWPSLCPQTFSLMACRNVCGDTSKSYLMADLEDHCWVGRHLQYAVGLGMPMLFIYVLGLPLAAYYLARRTHLMAYKVQELVEELGVDGAVEAEGGAKKKEERKSLKRMLTDTRRFRRESEVGGGGGGGEHINLSIEPHESSSSATTPSSPRPVKRPSKHRRWISRGINATHRTDSQVKKIQEIEQLLEQVEESHKTYGLFYSMYNEGRSL